MAIFPSGSQATFTWSSGASSAVVYLEEVSMSMVIEPFQRMEYSNERLRSVKNVNGGLPKIVTSITNTPLQLDVSCSGDVPRPLGPDSLANINNINQRFNIQRYTLKGSASRHSEIIKLYNLAVQHQKLLNNFQLHLYKGSSADISIGDLQALQAENFSYLTNTGLSLASDAINGTATQMLISEFAMSVAYEVTLADSSKLLLQEWTMTIENRTISSQAA